MKNSSDDKSEYSLWLSEYESILALCSVILASLWDHVAKAWVSAATVGYILPCCCIHALKRACEVVGAA